MSRFMEWNDQRLRNETDRMLTESIEALRDQSLEMDRIATAIDLVMGAGVIVSGLGENWRHSLPKLHAAHAKLTQLGLIDMAHRWHFATGAERAHLGAELSRSWVQL